jgi:hypothetical protein
MREEEMKMVMAEYTIRMMLEMLMNFWYLLALLFQVPSLCILVARRRVMAIFLDGCGVECRNFLDGCGVECRSGLKSWKIGLRSRVNEIGVVEMEVVEIVVTEINWRK